MLTPFKNIFPEVKKKKKKRDVAIILKPSSGGKRTGNSN